MLYLFYEKVTNIMFLTFTLTRPVSEPPIYRNLLMRVCQYSMASVYSDRQGFYDVIFDHICMVIYFLGYKKLLYTLINWGVVLSKQNRIMFAFVSTLFWLSFCFFFPFWFCLLYVCICLIIACYLFCCCFFRFIFMHFIALSVLLSYIDLSRSLYL